MIVLTGASASGKTEVAKYLAANFGITKVITTTTRPTRVGEVNGKDYFFVSKEKFIQMIKEDKFVEYCQYNGNYYGSQKDQIADDKCIVIEPIGVKAYLKLRNHNIVSFYLESSEAIRYERMLLRGDHKEDALKRISNDRVAFAEENLPKVHYRVESEESSVEEVAKKIYSIYKRVLRDRIRKRKK